MLIMDILLHLKASLEKSNEEKNEGSTVTEKYSREKLSKMSWATEI